MNLKFLVKEFIDILENREESESGKEFSPTTIHTCRCADAQRIGEIIKEMKKIIN